MQAFVSLWSADLLALREAVRQVDDLVDGFHIDVFDGHNVGDLLFGPDFVAALRGATTSVIDVHLSVAEPLVWVDRFADVGADVITVQSGPCRDVGEVLHRIAERGCQSGLGIELHESVDIATPYFSMLSRVLLLGTLIGVKGQQLDDATPDRVSAVFASRAASAYLPSIIVDGGIRKHTVPVLAARGADGVIPGSLVYGDNDPRRAVTEINELTPGHEHQPLSDFWTDKAAP